MITVYIDVLFLINFSLDYMSLYLTGKLLRLKSARWRLFVASLVMAIWGVWALLWCASYLILMVTLIFTAALGCYISFCPLKKRFLAKSVFTLCFVGACLGGAMVLLYRFLGHLIPQVTEGNGGGVKVVVFGVIAVISGIFIACGNRLLTSVRGKETVDAYIRLLEDMAGSFHLLVDSGNLVCDPMSGRRVVFLSEKAAKRVFRIPFTQSTLPSYRLRPLFIETAVGKRQVTAILPQEIAVDGKQVDALVVLLPNGDFHGCDGLFPSALLI